jgi:hypothetical protein
MKINLCSKSLCRLLIACFVLLTSCSQRTSFTATATKVSNVETATSKPLHTSTQILTTVISSTLSPTLTPTIQASQTPSQTLTPPVTLEPKQAKEKIESLMQGSEDCVAPCFLGIMPGQTTLGEGNNIFIRLGLQMAQPISLEDKKFYEVIIYKNKIGLSISTNLTVQNDIVKNLRIYITPEKEIPGVPRQWSAYSPETLIQRYGPPSKVDFFVGRAAPNPLYAMDMYFNSEDLIIEYGSFDLGSNLRICPLTDQIDNVRIWMGKDPQNPPLDAVPLENATVMAMDTFAKLMIGSSDKACFNLKGEAFP